MKRYKSELDLSSGDIDGSHTSALRGGQEVAYQGRKKKKTINTIFLTDRQGVPLAMSVSMAGNHHDCYQIEKSMDEIMSTMERAGIRIDGLLDEEIYKERYSIERTNAWIDSFRSLLNRFDTTVSSWLNFNQIAFIVVICLKKIRKRLAR